MKKTRIIIGLFILLNTILLNAQDIGLTQVTFETKDDFGTVLDMLTFNVTENGHHENEDLNYQDEASISINLQLDNPNGDLLYIQIYHDQNNDNQFSIGEQVYATSSTENIVEGDFVPCSGLGNKMCIALRDNPDNEPIFTTTCNSANEENGGPPIVVTTSRNGVEPPETISYCMPDTRLLKFFVHNQDEHNDYILTNVLVGKMNVDIMEFDATDARRKKIVEKIIYAEDTVPFWIDTKSLPEPLNPSDTYAVKCEFGDVCFQYEIIIGCCQDTHEDVNEENDLKYYIGAEESITVDGKNLDAIDPIIVREEKEVFLEASKCIVLEHGFETKANAIFEAKLSSTCTAPAQANRQINPSSKDKAFTQTTKRKKTGLTTKNTPLDFEIFPNPFEDKISIHFEHVTATPVSLMVYNITGQKVMTIMENVLYEKGEHQLVWGMSVLPKGSYFFRLYAGDKTTVQKMIKL